VLIRQAVLGDLESCIPLFFEFNSRYKVPETDFNVETVTHTAKLILGSHLMMVIDDNGIQGGIAGLILPSLFGSDVFFQELMFFVRKEHRRHTVRLLRETEDICKVEGINKVILGHFDYEKDKIKKFYGLMGYTYLETQYIKRLI